MKVGIHGQESISMKRYKYRAFKKGTGDVEDIIEVEDAAEMIAKLQEEGLEFIEARVLKPEKTKEPDAS